MKRLTNFFSLLTFLIIFATFSLTGCSLLPGDNITTRVPTATVPTAAIPTPEGQAAAPTQEVAIAPDATAVADTPAAESETETEAPSPTVAVTAVPEPTATPEPSPTAAAPPVYIFNVVATYPHDISAFTEGLDIDNGELYEGTGLFGESVLRQVELETGAVLRETALSAEYFGEGVTVMGDRIYQLSWQENTGFVYDRNTFEVIQTFSYTHEGWGLTHDDTRLIASDGTSTIYFWDPETLTEIGRINVTDNEGPVIQINELEYINGEIWANIWLTDHIARISPETGQVMGWVDLTGLLDTSTITEPVDVLNGIAYDEDTDKLYVTGKLWPTLFEIELVPAP